MDYGRSFAVGVVLNVLFVLLEAGCGVYSQSLALLADAGHNLSDVMGLLLAWGAIILARRRPTERRTYGFRRSTIIAALANAMLLLVAVGGISWEAIRRIARPEPLQEGVVIWVAAAGIIVNTATALLFLRGSHDVNIRGAFLHMAADAAVSLGVVVAGVVIYFTHWFWIDASIGLVIAAVILWSTCGVLWESLDLALDAVPKGIQPRAVEKYLASLPGVTEVHDLHIWGLSTTEAALTAHLVMPEASHGDSLLQQIALELHDQFGIEHATLQVERGNLAGYPCGTPCETTRGEDPETPGR
ncbi:MAG: cation diffusion facilitator family transporter [Planctomycetales bacterium]|nr:cation diffusion facilitator family transporter [Planctomycetales bacterium]